MTPFTFLSLLERAVVEALACTTALSPLMLPRSLLLRSMGGSAFAPLYSGLLRCPHIPLTKKKTTLDCLDRVTLLLGRMLRRAAEFESWAKAFSLGREEQVELVVRMFTLLSTVIVNMADETCFDMIQENKFGSLFSSIGCPALLFLPLPLRDPYRKVYINANMRNQMCGTNDIRAAFINGNKGLQDPPIVLHKAGFKIRDALWTKGLYSVSLKAPHFSLHTLCTPKHAPKVVHQPQNGAMGTEESGKGDEKASEEGESLTSGDKALHLSGDDIAEKGGRDTAEPTAEESRVEVGGGGEGSGGGRKGGRSKEGYSNQGEEGEDKELSALSVDEAGMAPPELEGGVEEEKGYSVDGEKIELWWGERLKFLAHMVLSSNPPVHSSNFQSQ